MLPYNKWELQFLGIPLLLKQEMKLIQLLFYTFFNYLKNNLASSRQAAFAMDMAAIKQITNC